MRSSALDRFPTDDTIRNLFRRFGMGQVQRLFEPLAEWQMQRLREDKSHLAHHVHALADLENNLQRKLHVERFARADSRRADEITDGIEDPSEAA
jgi:hypothetical protein